MAWTVQGEGEGPPTGPFRKSAKGLVGYSCNIIRLNYFCFITILEIWKVMFSYGVPLFQECLYYL